VVLAASIIALRMAAASTSETSVNFYQTTRRNNPEDSHLLLPISFKVTTYRPLTSATSLNNVRIGEYNWAFVFQDILLLLLVAQTSLGYFVFAPDVTAEFRFVFGRSRVQISTGCPY
jgi:hypothetical protein